ncbi:MAG: hypothetical protein QME96_19015 [Myxococcota bacterium]|nr:hypothetical protein [Myxococcota bacterium]
MSFYFDDRLWGILRLMRDDFLAARAGLLRKDLLAYDPAGPRYQVLALPARPVIRCAADDHSPVARTGGPPAHIRDLIRDFLTRMDHESR